MGTLIKIFFQFVVILFICFLILYPSEIWFFSFGENISLPGILFYLSFILLSWITLYIKKPVIQNLLVSILFLIFCLLFYPALPLGDSLYWLYYAKGKELFASQIFGNMLFHIVSTIFGDKGIDYLMPVLGFFTIFVYLNITLSILKTIFGEVNKWAIFITRLSFLGWGGHLLFLKGFTENTQTAIPFLLLHIFYLFKIFQEDNKFKFRDIFLCEISLGTACIFHGGNLFFLPALPVLILIKEYKTKNIKLLIEKLLISLSSFILPVAFGIFIALILGFRIVKGDVYGGADNQFFVPLNVEEENPISFSMFSHFHFTLLGNLIVYSSPFIFLLPFFFAKNKGKTKIQELPILQLLSLAYLSLCWLFQFDMGFPGDYDLMVSFSTPLLLWFLIKAIECFKTHRKTVFIYSILLFIGLGLNISTSWGAVHPKFLFSKRYQNVNPVLVINGISVSEKAGPKEVIVKNNSNKIQIKIFGKPNAFFFLLYGPKREKPHFKLFGLPIYIGKNPIMDIKVLLTGFLDSKGLWKKEFYLENNANGNVFSIQALLISGSGTKITCTGPLFIYCK